MKSFLQRVAHCFLLLIAFAPAARATLDPDRIREIAAMLPPHATSLGQSITNRAAWHDILVYHPDLTNVIALAVKDAATPLPDQPDSLYLEYSRDGNRTDYQKVAAARRDRIAVFTLAECLEDKGRFIGPLQDTIAAFCAERTWVLPAHDGKLENFNGQSTDIDLDDAMYAAELATANYLLGNRLSSKTRKLILDNLERRVFAPYRAAVNGGRPEFWWMNGSNNWDAVCLDGVTGAALATYDSPAERAWYIAAAEKYIGSYLAGGFTPDGYCVEGLGYWNYGFGNFALMSENIRRATGGQLDLLARPQAAQPALFGLRSEILNGVYTSIADCNPDTAPSPPLTRYLAGRFALPGNMYFPVWHADRFSYLIYYEVFKLFMPQAMPALPVRGDVTAFPWRTWFPDAGVLICRPGPRAEAQFAVAIKGRNNGVNHGHNDAGSFSVVVGKQMVICDPGGEVYTARTFGSHRYDSEVLNSFGHAVPIVAGQLQSKGKAAQAVLLATNFSTAGDGIVFDLRSAYPVSDLLKLERTFIFRRGASPMLQVRDDVAFASPENYESALITWGEIRRVSDNELEISDRGSAVRVSIDTQGHPFHLRQEVINENTENGRKPIHLGIVLNDKISSAAVMLRISPAKSN
ncbi:MAG TPA: heparinase II/III family protein [Pseudomonadales bacterium]|nr:heparinase II/III family protein [Pseudomonadales bacterium]